MCAYRRRLVFVYLKSLRWQQLGQPPSLRRLLRRATCKRRPPAASRPQAARMRRDGRAAPPGREGPRAGVRWGGSRSPTALASGSKADGASAGATVAWGRVGKRLQDVPEIVLVRLTCSIVRRTQKEQQESAPVQPVHSTEGSHWRTGRLDARGTKK